MTSLLTIPEAAQRLRISESMIRHLAQTGKLVSTKIGRRVLIGESDLESFAQSCRVGAPR